MKNGAFDAWALIMSKDKTTDSDAGRAQAVLESLCRRCGLCCHEKFCFGDQIIITDIPCKHLDPGTNQCRIYAERATLEPRCLSAAESAKGNGLPGNCPYVAGIADYQEPLLLSEHPEYELMANLFFPDRVSGREK